MHSHAVLVKSNAHTQKSKFCAKEISITGYKIKNDGPCNAIYILDISRDSPIINMFCITLATVGLSANLVSNIQT